MENLRRFRPSPAMVVASIALFVAIGGISWAAATIGTSDIKRGAVTKKKLHKKAVSSKKIAADAVSGAKIQDGAVARETLSDDQQTLWAAVQSNGTAPGRGSPRASRAVSRWWPVAAAPMRSTSVRMSRVVR